jgi:hypothetical protein
MNKFFLFIAMLLALSLNNIAFASDDDDERVHHYEISTPASERKALKLLRKSLLAMSGAVVKQDLYLVHEISYSSEAAIKALQSFAPSEKLKEKLKLLAYANEEVHEASEDGDPAELAREFRKLKKIWEQISPNYK